ncbi:poly(3-hydroxybutyrate) depolymerase [Motiliproteus sp. SC1-56]|uniref:extracellular catalytic domain type 2 short-chain-length polyhydroxyalkanoate depolymerase n=1 Tax=Motiliproteus sp. SC1-56 TaxID=2799565 RepID=UPI001A8CD0B1|nr:poly(3-hydroxybutyrate) depolymerase [Motiliproteus sp. SC1-56]
MNRKGKERLFKYALALLLSLSFQNCAAERLPALEAALEGTTVSGLSSGGYMASQFHVAYSATISGAGIIAGGPYYCAGTFGWPSSFFVVTATTSCMNPCRYSIWPFESACLQALLPDGEALADKAREHAEAGLIDTPEQLANDRVYLFSGGEDDTVVTEVVAEAERFYRAVGVPAAAIEFEVNPEAGHAFISDNLDHACDAHAPPFINNCEDYDQARALLTHLYGVLAANADTLEGEMLAFDQREFLDTDTQFESSGLADTGYLYIPKSCQAGGCALHVAFHGCRQSAAEIDTNGVFFHEAAGYNEVAENNRLLVLYPQIRDRSLMEETPYNPRGCWDFWGYSGADFFTQSGLQPQAVHGMINRLRQRP